MRPPVTTARLIGYAEFHRDHAALSRSEFLRLANGGAFGPVRRVGRKIMVFESAVRRWCAGPTTREIVQRHERSLIDDGRRGVEGKRGRATVGDAPSNADYATASEFVGATISGAGQ